MEFYAANMFTKQRCYVFTRHDTPYRTSLQCPRLRFIKKKSVLSQCATTVLITWFNLSTTFLIWEKRTIVIHNHWLHTAGLTLSDLDLRRNEKSFLTALRCLVIKRECGRWGLLTARKSAVPDGGRDLERRAGRAGGGGMVEGEMERRVSLGAYIYVAARKAKAAPGIKSDEEASVSLSKPASLLIRGSDAVWSATQVRHLSSTSSKACSRQLNPGSHCCSCLPHRTNQPALLLAVRPALPQRQVWLLGICRTNSTVPPSSPHPRDQHASAKASSTR